MCVPQAWVKPWGNLINTSCYMADLLNFKTWTAPKCLRGKYANLLLRSTCQNVLESDDERRSPAAPQQPTASPALNCLNAGVTFQCMWPFKLGFWTQIFQWNLMNAPYVCRCSKMISESEKYSVPQKNNTSELWKCTGLTHIEKIYDP